MDILTDWVESPLTGDVECIEMSERAIVSDEKVRQLILEKSGTLSIAEFQSHEKELKKDIIRSVMQETSAGPRQMSRVCGMTFSVIYRLSKTLKS